MKNISINTLFFFMLVYLNPDCGISQTAIKDIPFLKNIKVYETTGSVKSYIFNINDSRLYNRLGSSISIQDDFEGVPGAEAYDIYLSDANGNLNKNGEFITIECAYFGTSGGGGCNIAQLELNFDGGASITPTKLSSFLKNGNNYISGSELLAVDCRINTHSTMGNIVDLPQNKFLRLTFDIWPNLAFKEFKDCKNSGFTYEKNNIIFNQANPSGVVSIPVGDNCKYVEIVNIKFNELTNALFEKTLCKGDEFNVEFGNKIFNEANPEGSAIVKSNSGCDTLYFINLLFEDIINKNVNYTGCEGDGYFYIVGNQIFDENNNKAEFKVSSPSTCDTLYKIDLNFLKIPKAYYTDTFCASDNISKMIGDKIFDINRPKGFAEIKSNFGCDTMYYIDLIYLDCSIICEPHAPNIIRIGSIYNSIFEIKFNDLCQYNKAEFNLYDRWGNLIKYSSDPVWDGTKNGVLCEQGVYTYTFDYSAFNRKYHKHGNITLLR